MLARTSCFLMLTALLGQTVLGADESARPVRIGSGVSGHIHPAACITKKGTIVVIYCQADYRDHRLTRSTDGGKTWSEPVPYAPTAKLSIYPGSLTTLSDGRIVHAWNTWYNDDKQTDPKKRKSRYVQYSISDDEGKTWGETRSLPKNSEPSIIRHPIIELDSNAWLMALADQTAVYDPKTEKITPFGDGHKHGLVPIVRTIKGTFVSGAGLRSTDGGKTWTKIAGMPNVSEQGWRHEMTTFDNGWLMASEILGPGVGGEKIRFVVSRDDGQTWDTSGAVEYYNPGRPIGGRACPRTVQIDKDTIGTVFYDVDANQSGGSGIFFLRTPLKRLAGK